jgi:16S rRNA (guanine966-N2)-methyltransferase
MPQKSARAGTAARGVSRTASRLRNEVRIIAGEWRGRRVGFAPVPALRPTPDRVRETLFNWLQPVVQGSRCLDLFAGSGALGLEALSRGAARVLFVDSEREVVTKLRAALATFGTTRGEVRHDEALGFLGGRAEPFDIVFVDPPFQGELLRPACQLLEERGWLVPGAHIYLEMPARDGPPPLPSGWTLARTKRAGEVGYHLALRGDATAQDCP